MGGILQFKRSRQEVGQEGEMCAPHAWPTNFNVLFWREINAAAEEGIAPQFALHLQCNANQHSAGVMPCCQALWSVKTTRQLPSPTSHPWPCRTCDLFCKMECPPPPSVLQWELRGLIAMGLSPTLP